MVKTWNIGRHFLMGHGVLMLCLGIALCLLGSLMADPSLDTLGYTTAVVLTALGLLISVGYLEVMEYRAGQRRLANLYLLAGALSIACWLIFWLIQSAPTDLRLLVLLAGLHGLFWGLWYVRLADHFQAYARKAVVLSVLAATTASIGIILATQSQPSKLSAVTAVACYMMFIGIEILLTTLYLYRECGKGGELLSESSPKGNETA